LINSPPTTISEKFRLFCRTTTPHHRNLSLPSDESRERYFPRDSSDLANSNQSKEDKKMTIKSRLNQVYTAALLATGMGILTPAQAADTTIECTLYIAQSLDSAASHAVQPDQTAEQLMTIRRAGYCIFDDGSVADKQFVMTVRAMDGGKSGSNQGYSVYTMSNGDSISAEFSGSWGDGPYQGTYNILGGSGAYANASGDGTLSGQESPWSTTAVVKVVMNVSTP